MLYETYSISIDVNSTYENNKNRLKLLIDKTNHEYIAMSNRRTSSLQRFNIKTNQLEEFQSASMLSGCNR